MAKTEKEYERIRDVDYVKIREQLETEYGFMPISQQMMREVVMLVAEENQFDSLIDACEALEGTWDGVPRVSEFLSNYMGADDREYVRAVSLNLWTSMAGRALVPGIKADIVTILIGEQGIKKSTGIEAMCLLPDTYGELSMAASDDNKARMTKGKSIVEIGELRGFHSGKIDHLKAYITKTFDEWVPKYQENPIRYQRRCIFIGTTNHENFLVDSTGNRRFAPVVVRDVKVKDIKRDRKQLWAEAIDIFKKQGILYADVERLAQPEHEEFMVEDPWEYRISQWLGMLCDIDAKHFNSQRKDLTTLCILQEAIGLDVKLANGGHGKHVGEIMRSLGYVSLRGENEGKRTRTWRPKSQKSQLPADSRDQLTIEKPI